MPPPPARAGGPSYPTIVVVAVAAVVGVSLGARAARRRQRKASKADNVPAADTPEVLEEAVPVEGVQAVLVAADTAPEVLEEVFLEEVPSEGSANTPVPELGERMVL